MKKKNGFTLVELIAALAILSIGLTGITFAFSSAGQIRKNEDIKLDTAANCQIIAETFRANGKVYLDDVYKTYPAKIKDANNRNNIYLYIFFDDVSELKTNISNKSFMQTIGITGNFSDCKSINTSGPKKKFGANIQITDFTDTNSYTLYRINATVWNLSYGENPNSQLTFYIGS